MNPRLAKLDLKEHLHHKDRKQTYVNRMFATIAPRYDRVTVWLSFGMDRKWKRQLVEMAAIQPDFQILDMACGTGDIAFLMAERLKGGRVTGVDLVPEMLAIARSRCRAPLQEKILFEQGDIQQLPYPDRSFERITVGYGVRNVPDIPRLLAEVYRLLSPGGQFLSLDFGKPDHRLYRRAYLAYLTIVGSTFGWLLHRDPDVYRYIPESLKLYPGQRGVRDLMSAAGFVETGIVNFLSGAIAINYGSKPAAQDGGAEARKEDRSWQSRG
ncbi:MAG: ubiquinone/menaquinone biosynthesis methyltransferase [Acidobacteriota bacterium]